MKKCPSFIKTDILEMMAKGMTGKDIANATRYKYSSIQTYKERIMKEYGAINSNHLIAICYQKGILK